MHITPVVLAVTDVPLIDYERSRFEITIEWTGGMTWAVRHNGTRQCLNTDLEWEWEPQPSERDNAWLATHRFTTDQAFAAARIAHERMMASAMEMPGAVAAAEKTRRIPTP